jgi:hypothetical protein
MLIWPMVDIIPEPPKPSKEKPTKRPTLRVIKGGKA